MTTTNILIAGYRIDFPDDYTTYGSAYEFIQKCNTDQLPDVVLVVSRNYDSIDIEEYGFYISGTHFIFETGSEIIDEGSDMYTVLAAEEVDLEDDICDFVQRLQENGATISEFHIFSDICDVDRTTHYI
jgi:hypothetical protein